MLLICGMKNSHGQYQQNLCEILRRVAWKQPPEVLLCKKSLFKNLANLTGKHLYWSLFLIKLQA